MSLHRATVYVVRISIYCIYNRDYLLVYFNYQMIRVNVTDFVVAKHLSRLGVAVPVRRPLRRGTQIQ